MLLYPSEMVFLMPVDRCKPLQFVFSNQPKPQLQLNLGFVLFGKRIVSEEWVDKCTVKRIRWLLVPFILIYVYLETVHRASLVFAEEKKKPKLSLLKVSLAGGWNVRLLIGAKQTWPRTYSCLGKSVFPILLLWNTKEGLKKCAFLFAKRVSALYIILPYCLTEQCLYDNLEKSYICLFKFAMLFELFKEPF